MAAQAKHLSKLALLVFLVALALVVPGCLPGGGKATKVSSTAAGGTLRYSLGEPVAIDPAYALESEGLQVVKQVFDGLVDYDPETLEVKPAVAARWRSNKAGDEWTFWLREGVRFHNGAPVRAADFIYAWNRVADRKTASPVAYHLAPIKGFDKVQSGKKPRMSGLSAPEPYILKVKLAYAFADFPVVLGHPVFSPVPRKEVIKDRESFAAKPIGNGPFEMAEPWKNQESIKIARFDDYYGQKALLDGVDFRIADSKQTTFLQFQGGAIDYASIPSGQIKVVNKQFGQEAIVGQALLVLDFYGFNLRGGPFKNNAKLRQAVGYAVNRDVIAERIYEGAYVAAGGIVPPAIADYRRPKNSYSYSPAKARALLKAAGYPGGKGLPTVKLIYGAGRGDEEPAQIFQENLREIGVKVKLEALERGAFIKALQAGKMTMFAAGWAGDYPSRDAFLYALFHSESDDNMLGYSNDKVDELIIEARQTPKAADRRRLYDRAEELILKDAPIVPLTFAGTSVVHARNVKGFVRTALDDTPLDRVRLGD